MRNTSDHYDSHDKLFNELPSRMKERLIAQAAKSEVQCDGDGPLRKSQHSYLRSSARSLLEAHETDSNPEPHSGEDLKIIEAGT